MPLSVLCLRVFSWCRWVFCLSLFHCLYASFCSVSACIQLVQVGFLSVSISLSVCLFLFCVCVYSAGAGGFSVCLYFTVCMPLSVLCLRVFSWCRWVFCLSLFHCLYASFCSVSACIQLVQVGFLSVSISLSVCLFLFCVCVYSAGAGGFSVCLYFTVCMPLSVLCLRVFSWCRWVFCLSLFHCLYASFCSVSACIQLVQVGFLSVSISLSVCLFLFCVCVYSAGAGGFSVCLYFTVCMPLSVLCLRVFSWCRWVFCLSLFHCLYASFCSVSACIQLVQVGFLSVSISLSVCLFLFCVCVYSAGAGGFSVCLYFTVCMPLSVLCLRVFSWCRWVFCLSLFHCLYASFCSVSACIQLVQVGFLSVSISLSVCLFLFCVCVYSAGAGGFSVCLYFTVCMPLSVLCLRVFSWCRWVFCLSLFHCLHASFCSVSACIQLVQVGFLSVSISLSACLFLFCVCVYSAGAGGFSVCLYFTVCMPLSVLCLRVFSWCRWVFCLSLFHCLYASFCSVSACIQLVQVGFLSVSISLSVCLFLFCVCVYSAGAGGFSVCLYFTVCMPLSVLCLRVFSWCRWVFCLSLFHCLYASFCSVSACIQLVQVGFLSVSISLSVCLFLFCVCVYSAGAGGFSVCLYFTVCMPLSVLCLRVFSWCRWVFCLSLFHCLYASFCSVSACIQLVQVGFLSVSISLSVCLFLFCVCVYSAGAGGFSFFMFFCWFCSLTLSLGQPP